MTLDAGRVAVRVGADFEGRGFDSLDRAVNKAKAVTAKAIKQTLGFEADEGELRRWDRSVTAARAKAHRPIKQQVELDVDWRSFAAGMLATRQGAAALTKESSKLTDVFNRSHLSIGQWVVGLGAALPVIVDLGAALGALTASAAAAMAGLGALAIGAGGALTVGFGGIAAIAAPAISSLTDLMTAQEAANKSQVTGAAGASRAAAASAQQITSAREAVTTATRGVTTAEEQLEAAQRSEEIAQESLTAARADAERQLQDMRRAAAETASTEEAARIALARAQQNLTRVMADATSGNLDVREAENEVTQARENLRDVTIAGNRAEQDYRRARRGGVDEMPGVVAAEQAYDDAIRGVHTAQDGVEQAHREVTKALQNLTYQQKQANAATGAGGTALAALALAQRKAGPVAVKFAKDLKEMGREWRGLTKAGRDDFFGMLGDGVDRLRDKLPMLARSANRSMDALRGGFNDFLDKATGPEFDHFIHVMTRTFADSIGPISRGLGNIAKVLQRIAVAVAPDLVKMSEGFEGMTEGWLDSTKNAGKLRETVHGLVEQTAAWWDLLVATKDLIVAALVPGMDEGKGAVEGITAQFEEWTDWLNKHPDDVRRFFADGLDTARELGEIVLDLIVMLKDVADFIRPIAGLVIDIADGINSIKVGNVSALEGLLAAFVAFKGAGKIRDAVRGVRDLTGSIRGSAAKARDLFETARLWGMYAREGVADFMGNIISGIRTRAGRVRSVIGRVMSAGRTFVTSAATGAAEFVGSMIGGIRSSRLARGLREIFSRIAVRLGKIMAATTAAAVVVGEGIGGVASSLGGLLEKRLPGPMGSAGRIAGRAFGAAFILGAAAAAAWGLYQGAKAAADIPGNISDALHGHDGSDAPPETPAEARAGQRPRGPKPSWAGHWTGLGWTIAHPRRRQHGGPVTSGDPFLVGEAGPEMFVPHAAGQIVPRHRLGRMAGIDEDSVKLTGDRAKRIRKAVEDSFAKAEKDHDERTDRMRKRTRDRFDDMQDRAVDSTKDLHRKVGGEYHDLDRDHEDSLRSMAGTTRRRFDDMADTARQESRKLSDSVRGSMREVTGVVFRGMAYVGRATNKALEAFDVKRIHLNLETPKLRQRGGHLPGGRTGDHNLLAAEDDEYVLNRNVTRGLGKGVLDWLNFKVYPRQHGGAVGGGMQAMVSEANKFERRHFPYAWGGGHGGFGVQPVDCSGAVSQVLHAAGLLDRPMVSGALAHWGKPGRGPLTVYANPEHTFMSLSGRYFGTSSSNPGGGAGWMSDPGASYLSRFAARTMDVAGGMSRIKRLLVKGTDGPPKDIAQAAVDAARDGGNRYIDRKMPSGAFGGGDIQADGDVERIFAMVAKKRSTSRVATMALGEAGYAETGMVDSPGGMDSSEGALQLLASTAAGMGIDPHDEGAVASAFLLRGFTGRGGANALAAQGLPAHLVAQGVQGSRFSSGSNYAAQRGPALGWMRRFSLQRGGIVGMQAGGAAGGFNPARARRNWRQSFGVIPEHFEDLFEAIGAGNQGRAGRAEGWLTGPAVGPAQKIEAKIIAQIEQQMRQTQRRARRQLGSRWLRRHDVWGDNSWLPTGGRADRILGGMRRTMHGLRGQAAGWEGRTDRRVEQMLRGGFGQLSQFQADRSELFDTFGSNFEGPLGPGAGFGPRNFGATGGAVAGPLEASGGAFGGSRVINGDIHLNNYFRETPPEPHIWARGTMFELRSAA